MRSLRHRTHRVLDWWNNGAALDNPHCDEVEDWFEAIAKRARHDATAQRASVRKNFQGRAVAGK